MKKRIISFVIVMVSVFVFCSCGKDEKVLITEWPADAFDFMAGIPEYKGEQYTAEISRDYETVSIYYKEASLDSVHAYIKELENFGLVENISTNIVDGKFHWMSKLAEGELFAEIMWYDTEYELVSESYKYGLVIKFAEF